MSSFTIKSRNHGEQVFTVPLNGGYVRLNGQQICDGGRLLGNTISLRDPANLEKAARKWWKSYLRNQRAY